MLYRVTHETEYAYDEPVTISHNVVRLRPRELAGQRVLDTDLTIQPWPALASARLDYFGNHTTFATIQQPHDRVVFTNVSEVEVTARAAAANPPAGAGLFTGTTAAEWERIRELLHADHSPAGLDAAQFAFDSPLVTASDRFADYARASFPPGRAIDAAARDLMSRIFADFKYDPNATTVATPLDDAFDGRCGVCQDFAHVMLACVRALGLAGRYVSGYLRTFRDPAADPKLIGADASHAWVSVYCGPLGWIDFDPTNNQLPSVGAEHHVTVAWGRDYNDVAPVKGMILGGGDHHVTVRVNVEPIASTSFRQHG